MTLDPLLYEEILRSALREDIGPGDITTRVTVPEAAVAQGTFLVKGDGVLCGLALAARTFALVDERIVVTLNAADGDCVASGTVVATLAGPARGLLTAERVALNVVQQLSGVATLTRRFVDAVAGTDARIVDTRKTTPGLRALEKYAVRCGGGHNHRFGLADGVLIKDNHLAAGGGVAACVARAKSEAPHPLRIEVECKSLAQVEDALRAGADVILLDNMPPDILRQAVTRIDGRALTEASGGVNLTTVRAIAETGVDLISVGALTHSAPALDISMDVEE
jgi:nicotinate-nucleotide pyrophosphorylase (carboxylating)